MSEKSEQIVQPYGRVLDLAYTTYPARAYRSTSQNLRSGAASQINFDVENFDPADVFTPGSGAKYTAPAAGYYSFQISIYILSGTWSVGQGAEIRIYKNGSKHISTPATWIAQAAGTLPVYLNGSDIIQLAAGDYITINVFQNSGSTVSLGGFSSHSFVAISRVG